jgi:hypothetical protein
VGRTIGSGLRTGLVDTDFDGKDLRGEDDLSHEGGDYNSPGSQIMQELRETASQHEVSENLIPNDDSSLVIPPPTSGLPLIEEQREPTNSLPSPSPIASKHLRMPISTQEEEMFDADVPALIDRLDSEHTSSKNASPVTESPFSHLFPPTYPPRRNRIWK